MKNKIKNIIKYNKWVRMVFRRVGSFLLIFLGVFVPVKRKRVLFLSFGGRQYSDSPRAVYEGMKKNPFFQDYEMIWAFERPDEHRDIGCKVVKVDSPKYFIYALSSKIWVTNTSICRGLQFKKKNTICVNTWHGSPLKKMGYSLDPDPRFKERIDIGCCQNKMDREIFLRLFCVKRKNLLPVDLPRNDALLRYSKEDITGIRSKLGIPEDKKVLLYMPTYRDYNVDSKHENFFVPPMDFLKWKAELGDKYVLVVRFHYLIEKMIDIPDDGFVINATDYEELNDLYAVADVMISDYSSSYIDYSILQRPMFCFGYDFDEYNEWRGFELDFEKMMPFSVDRTEDEVIRHIKTMNEKEEIQKAEKFHRRFTPYAGAATEKVIQEIISRIQ